MLTTYDLRAIALNVNLFRSLLGVVLVTYFLGKVHLSCVHCFGQLN